MNGSVILAIAKVIVPSAQRVRMAEEWAADLAGCAELGLTRSTVALGALHAAAVARARHAVGIARHVLDTIWPVAVGILFGIACALGDMPVLLVVLVAAGLHLPVLVVALWRRRASAHRLRSGHVN